MGSEHALDLAQLLVPVGAVRFWFIYPAGTVTSMNGTALLMIIF